MFIAAFRYFQVSKVPARGQYPFPVCQRLSVKTVILILCTARKDLIQRLSNLIDGCGAQHRVHLVDFLSDFLSVTFGKASCHEHTEHHLGIDQILIAPKGYEEYFFPHSRLPLLFCGLRLRHLLRRGLLCRLSFVVFVFLIENFDLALI